MLLQNCLQNVSDPRVIVSDEAFGKSSGPTFTINSTLSCSGLEASLADCDGIISTSDIGLCASEEIIGLFCEGQFEGKYLHIHK